MKNKIKFNQLFLYYCGSWILTINILMMGRLYLLFNYTSSQFRDEHGSSLFPFFKTALLFDIKSASIIWGSIFLLSAIASINTYTSAFLEKYLAKINSLILFIIAALTIANIFYFHTYDKQFDVFIFGLLEDDTKAVITTLWSDYPVLKILLSWFILGIFFYYISVRWQRFMQKLNWNINHFGLKLLCLILIFVLIALGARASLGTFPLRRANMQVSTADIINQMVPNAIMSLSWAVKDQKSSSEFNIATDDEGQQLITVFKGEKSSANLTQFIVKTPLNAVVEKHRPNVVLAIMESMSGHLLEFDNQNRDVLGQLRPHFEQDWLYHRFISEGDGTSDTLHRFFIRSPLNNVSQSNKQNQTFLSNMFQPYLDQGYEVIYITAGNGAWRNFNQFLSHLGVDEVIEENSLSKHYPQAEKTTWGVPDEYMFRYALERLQQAKKNGKPVFIMMMSVTNHPPYKLPTTATHQDFILSKSETERLSKLAVQPVLNEIFNTFYYNNDQLGKFISAVKADDTLVQDTIIAATGDHNIRAIGYPDPKEQALGHAVPFYLYVPSAYQQNALYDSNRVGSHKDIVPTLYHLSLSDGNYYQSGCNITAVTLDSTWCGAGYNPNVLITQNGAYNFKTNSYRVWENQQGLILGDVVEPKGDELALIHRWQAFTPLLHWQLNRQVNTN